MAEATTGTGDGGTFGEAGIEGATRNAIAAMNAVNMEHEMPLAVLRT